MLATVVAGGYLLGPISVPSYKRNLSCTGSFIDITDILSSTTTSTCNYSKVLRRGVTPDAAVQFSTLRVRIIIDMRIQPTCIKKSIKFNPQLHLLHKLANLSIRTHKFLAEMLGIYNSVKQVGQGYSTENSTQILTDFLQVHHQKTKKKSAKTQHPVDLEFENPEKGKKNIGDPTHTHRLDLQCCKEEQ
ncbi:hypothetical protein M758_UG060700 [Ceratodon purpureus]|nr:hypothetical protein M758_UG060700 [Ceratodon purpureus]